MSNYITYSASVFSFYCVQGFSSGPVELQAHYLTSLPTVSIQFLWALIRYVPLISSINLIDKVASVYVHKNIKSSN